jgi:hypothetical protein
LIEKRTSIAAVPAELGQIDTFLTPLLSHCRLPLSTGNHCQKPNSWATVIRVFLLAIHSHLYSFAMRFLFLQSHTTFHVFLQTQATSYILLRLSYCTGTLHRKKAENLIENHVLRNPYRNLKSENSTDYAQKRYCVFMGSASV